MGWYRKSGFTSVFTFDDGFKIGACYFMQTDINQCSDYGANHIAQESVGGNRKNKLVGVVLPMRGCDFTIERIDIGMHFREAFEIGMQQ